MTTGDVVACNPASSSMPLVVWRPRAAYKSDRVPVGTLKMVESFGVEAGGRYRSFLAGQ